MKTMKFAGVFGAVLVLLAMSAPTQAAFVLVTQGSISTPTNVIAADGWSEATPKDPTHPGFMVSWDIEKEWNGTKWIYSYEYKLSDKNGNSLSKALSHWILEVSNSPLTPFTIANIWDLERNGSTLAFTSGDPQTYSTSGGSGDQPNMPASIFGLKFAGVAGAPVYTFLSDRRPMWGDFYAKDGSEGGQVKIWATAWNSGLQFPGDPNSAFIPVPDTGFDPDPPVVPEPGTLVIWGLGGLCAAGAAALRRRKVKQARWSEETRNAIFAVVHARSE